MRATDIGVVEVIAEARERWAEQFTVQVFSAAHRGTARRAAARACREATATRGCRRVESQAS